MIEWKVVSIDVAPSVNGYEDVVVIARWVCLAAQDDKTGGCIGATALGKPQSAFIEYAKLTETDILEFCWNSGTDKAATEKKAIDDLQRALQATAAEKPLPWKPVASKSLVA